MNNGKSTSVKSKARSKKVNGRERVVLSSAQAVLVAMTDALEDILRAERRDASR